MSMCPVEDGVNVIVAALNHNLAVQRKQAFNQSQHNCTFPGVTQPSALFTRITLVSALYLPVHRVVSV